MFGVTLTGANMLFITQHLQFVEGLSPLHAGLWTLPAVAASVVGFLTSPLIARRVRPARLIVAGLGVSVIGALLFTQVQATAAGLSLLVVAYAMWNLGAAPLVSLSTDLVVGSAPPARAGAAASLSETSAEFAFALGIAVLGSLGTAVYRAQLVASLPAGIAGEAARDSLGGAMAAAASLPEPLAMPLLLAAREAFTSGMHLVAAISAVVLCAVAVFTLRLLGHVRPIGSTQQHAAAPSPLDLSIYGEAA
jgi:DHA2 family multidrug resistance protein-like MFS transporter